MTHTPRYLFAAIISAFFATCAIAQSDFTRDSLSIIEIRELDSVTTIQITKKYPTVREARKILLERRRDELKNMREEIKNIRIEERRLARQKARLERIIARYEAALNRN